MIDKDKDLIRDDFNEDKNLINEENTQSFDDSDVKEYKIGDEIDFKALMEAEEDKAESTRPLYRSSELEQYREEYAMKMGGRDLDKELNSWTYPSEKKESKILKFIGNIAQGFIGMALALFLFLSILPKTTLFKTSAMGKYISDISNNAAYDAASSVLANVSGKLSAFENQKEILSEVSTQKTMKVSEIVSQYKSAVVTVLTKNYQIPGDTTSGFRTFIGTGFILNSDGLVATNHHVIDGADEISVLLSDGTEVNASVINTDDATDLAIIRLDGNIKVEGVVTFGNSDEANVGDEVVAIGNPVSRNFSGTVTAGIISGKDRVVEIAGTKISYIQTDAAINEGNSGGPLFNDRGEVIGINTAKIHNNNTEGISFAIPINTLKEKMAILSQPPVYMGITARDMDMEALRKLKISNGVEIIEVRQGSPAYNSGIQVGDVVLKFNDIVVTSTTQMNEIKMKYKVGSEITLSILRGNEIIDKKFQLIARP